jgi:hypothetical protein
MISVASYEPHNAPNVAKAFHDCVAAAVDKAVARDQESSRVDAYDLKPGQRELLARIKTLIANDKPNNALDLIVQKLDAKEMQGIADKVYEFFIDHGYENAAKEMAALFPEISEPKVPAPTHATISKFIM